MHRHVTAPWLVCRLAAFVAPRRPDKALEYLSHVFKYNEDKPSFSLSICKLEHGKSATGKGGRQGKKGQSRTSRNRVAVSQAAVAPIEAAPESDYGMAPAGKAPGIGMDESEAQFWGQVRSALSLFLDLCGRTGAVKTLGAAAEYLRKTEPYSGPAFEDMRVVADGQHVLALFTAAGGVCPLDRLAPEDAEAASGGELTGGQEGRERRRRHFTALAAELDVAVAKPLLQPLYKLWADHTVLRVDGQPDWMGAVVPAARFALSLSSARSGPYGQTLGWLFAGTASQPAAGLYGELYLHILAHTRMEAGPPTAVEELRKLLPAMKQRHVCNAMRVGTQHPLQLALTPATATPLGHC